MVSAARRRLVYRALKASITRGEEVEYWIVKVSEQYDAGVLAEAQMIELMKLAEPFLPEEEYIEPEPETVEPEETVTEPETPVETPLETYEESDTSW